MTRLPRIVALAAMAVLASGVPSAVATAPQPRSSDEAALVPSRQPKDAGVEQRVNALISQMTLQEKLQQIQLLSDGQVTDADARAGVGGVFSLVDPV
ncbi:MAG: beta-glucosidase, partial [Frankiaceae bacterium]|nr:beta-glucosidase [Frankiaceae bacterium]